MLTLCTVKNMANYDPVTVGQLNFTLYKFKNYKTFDIRSLNCRNYENTIASHTLCNNSPCALL